VPDTLAAPPEPALEIRLLGELAVVRGGRRLELPASKRTRALLGYLAATGRPHLRSQLCDLLWEGPDDPRAALRWSLAKLRPLVDEEGASRLAADRERVALEPRGALIDVAAVRSDVGPDPAAADLAALRRAAGRFRGEFLDGLELPDCFRYHQWCAAEREACRTLRGGILQALVARVPSPEDALAHAREWVAVDPLREAAHAALVRCLGATGRVRDALAQYDACARVLAEVGGRPSAELEQARRALARPSAPAAAAAPLVESPPATEPTPFVGRREEQAELQGLVRGAAAGGARRVALVTGEPGIGKTRLLDALADEVRGQGGRVTRGRAFEAEGVRAYGAWIDALRSLPVAGAAGGLTADLAPLLPELEPGAPAGSDRNRLFDAVVALLRRLAEAQPPLAVILDDVHWLDEASLALIHYVARALEEAPILLAGGARPGELFDNPAALRLSRALAREGRLRELPLAPLDAEDTARLARAVAPHVDPRRVFADSQGHPLLVLEVARALDTGDETASETLTGLLEDRLERLDEPARELLPWMAALGRGFSLELLGAVSSAPAPRLLDAIETLERHRILREGQEGAHTVYQFAHDLVRTAAYRRMSEPRRRLVHGHIARVLHGLSDPDGMRVADVAHHAGLAGDHGLCAEACLQAGQRFLRMFAYAEAAELCDRGLPHAARLAPRERIYFSVGLLRLRIHSAMTAQEAARIEPALQALAREAEDLRLPDQVRVALEALTFVNWYSGNLSRAHSETLRHADVARAARPQEAAQGLANAARCLGHLERDPLRTGALLLEARQIAGPRAGDILDLVWAQGLLHRYRGEYDSAVEYLQRALALGREVGDRYCEWDCLARLAMVELERGRPTAALERCRVMEPLLAQMGEGSEPAFSAALAALARGAAGEPAEDDIERAIEALVQLDSRWMVAYASAIAATLDEQRGLKDRARRRAGMAMEAAEAVDRRSEAAVARALLARLALADRDVIAARKWLHVHDIDLERGILSARARTALTEVADALGEPIPTLATTVRTTPAK
jgi:DNA-binding SARP family transcriptional activator